MASPQVENGYIRIAVELFEALAKIRVPGEQRQVLDYIVRMTYGYGRKSADLRTKDFSEFLGIKVQNVCRAINGLKNKNMIIVIKKDNKVCSTYCIQKDYQKWKPLSKKIMLSKKITNVIKKDNTPIKDNLKDNNPPIVPPKKSKSKKPFTPPTGAELQANGQPWINVESWDEWLQYRREIRKPIKSKSTVTKQLNFLEKHKDHQKEIIDNSITNQWTGLFKPKKDDKSWQF